MVDYNELYHQALQESIQEQLTQGQLGQLSRRAISQPGMASPSRHPVVVTGGRDYTITNPELRQFILLMERFDRDFVMVGDAKGVDADIAAYCVKHNIEFEIFYADWKEHGKAAGPIRNGQMIDKAVRYTSPIIAAFNGGKWTMDCIRQGLKAGLPVFLIRNDRVRVILEGYDVPSTAQTVQDLYLSQEQPAGPEKARKGRSRQVSTRVLPSVPSVSPCDGW